MLLSFTLIVKEVVTILKSSRRGPILEIQLINQGMNYHVLKYQWNKLSIAHFNEISNKNTVFGA